MAIQTLTELIHDYLIKFGRVYRRLTDEHVHHLNTQEVSDPRSDGLLFFSVTYRCRLDEFSIDRTYWQDLVPKWVFPIRDILSLIGKNEFIDIIKDLIIFMDVLSEN
jgi:hypothetical protein